jgi:histidinol phosphatase-like PHP family hydrolase
LKIDLHVHASERSSCARATEEEQIRAAIAAGLDALVFTDHWKLIPLPRLEELNRRYAPFRIFNGVEVTADGEDYLVLGVRSPRLESNGWNYPDLHAFVRGQNGWLALAHPYRYHPIPEAITRFLPDALEIHSINTPTQAQAEIRAAAQRLGLPLLSNSDSHATETLGRYFNILARWPADEADLIGLLRAGKFDRFVYA